MASDPRISLCMIVRDEEQRLPRCLEAARPHVDEIVIVDTGSTDGTVAIAKRFKARVVHMEWQDDFSAARNRSIEEATGDWVLVLDADEVISANAGISLREAAATDSAICASFEMRCAEGDGQETLSRMVRAFRRRDDIRYRYRLHEQVLPDILRIVNEEGLGQVRCNGEIWHEGYLPSIMEERGKDERNRRIYELQLAETPDDIYVLYKYADFIRRFPDEQAQSRDLLERCYAKLHDLDVARRKSLTFGGQICALLGQSVQRSGEVERAWEITSYGTESCRETADLHYVHGNGALMRGDGALAEEAFHRCRALEGKPGAVATLPHITGLGAMMGLARARFLQGWEDEAAAEAGAVLEAYPDSDEALNLWIELQTRTTNWPEIVSRLMKIVLQRPSWGLAWLRGGEVLLRLRLYKKALPWLMRSEELLDDTEECLAMQGECLLGLGMSERAMDTWERGLPHLRCYAGLIVLQVLCRIDPEELLEASNADLVRACRHLMERVHADEGHPFREQLEAARSWIVDVRSENRPFLEQALAAAG